MAASYPLSCRHPRSCRWPGVNCNAGGEAESDPVAHPQLLPLPGLSFPVVPGQECFVGSAFCPRWFCGLYSARRKGEGRCSRTSRRSTRECLGCSLTRYGRCPQRPVGIGRFPFRSSVWSRRQDLNPRPSDYKSDALPAELRRPGMLQGSLVHPLRVSFGGAGSENRTRTLLPEPDFESGASTSSAIPARSPSVAQNPVQASARSGVAW